MNNCCIAREDVGVNIAFDLQAAVRDEELAEGRAQLSQAEKTLDMLRRKLVIVGRAGAGEEVRGRSKATVARAYFPDAFLLVRKQES